MVKTRQEHLIESLRGVNRESNRIRHAIEAGTIGSSMQREQLRSLWAYVESLRNAPEYAPPIGHQVN